MDKHSGKVGAPAPVRSEYLVEKGGKEPNCLLLLYDRFVGSDLSIADKDNSVGVLRDIVFMRDEDNRVALPVKVFEQRHNLFAGFRIEVASWLIRQNDRGRIDKGSGNRHTLSLAA